MAIFLEKSQSVRLSSYWRQTVTMTLCLTAVWVLVSFAPLWLAQMPGHWTFLGWPVAYAIVAFLIPVSYLLLIGWYAWRMERLDRRCSETAEQAYSIEGRD